MYVQIDNFTCNADLIIVDHSTPIIVSLVDVPIKNKKIAASFVSDHLSINIGSWEDHTFQERLYVHNEAFRYRHDKVDEILTHTLIYNKKIDQYIIDWDNMGLIKSITCFLRNKKYMPVTEKIVELVYNKCQYKDTLLKPMSVYTNEDRFKKLKAYKMNERYFLEILESIEVNYNDKFNWDEIENIEDYIFEFMEPIKEKLTENVKVLFDPRKINMEMFEGKKKPFTGQIPIIQSTIEVLKSDRYAYLGCEQGFGKTLVASKALHSYFKQKNKHNYSCLIVAPAITITQWVEELRHCINDKINIVVIKKTVDFIKWYNENNNSIKVNMPTFFIVGKETFKLSSKKIPGVLSFKRKFKAKFYDESKAKLWGEKSNWSWSWKKENVDICICPDCGKPLVNPLKKDADKISSFLSSSDFTGNPKKSTYKCSKCGAVLWQDSYDKTKKTSLINFIKVKHLVFDMVVQDEIHQSNNAESIIGNASKTLLNHGKKHLLLSGTSNNGYASSLYNILSGLIPNTLLDNNINSEEDFVKQYGTLMAIQKQKDGEYYSRGRSQIKESDWVETEGINPIVFTKFLSKNYIFAELCDLGKDLPDLNEYYIKVEQLNELSRNENHLASDIKSANAFNYKMYENSIVKHYVNNPYNWSPITIMSDKQTDVQPINLIDDIILPKEQKLAKIIKQELSEKRKVWIYTDFTGDSGSGQYMQGENIPERIIRILKESGIKVYWLKPSIKPIDRKEIIEKNKDNYDVFISNPKLVEVGINMVWCPTYIVYTPSYNVLIIDQATKRGYRANASIENRIYHMYYENTVEDEIIVRYQKKKAESKAIEGKFNVQLQNDSIRTASAFGKKINDNIAKEEAS